MPHTPFFSGPQYTSQPGSPGWFCRLLPSFAFYTQLARIVFDGGMQTRKGLYTAQSWAESSEAVARLVEQVGGRIEVSGLEHSRSLQGPCVFIGNHMSTLETFLLPSMIQPWRDVTFIVKESLLKYPLFGPLLGTRNPVALSRKNPRHDLEKALSEGHERLQQGTSLIIFPQSTRSVVFEPAHFNSIGVKIAKKAGVPVIPLALSTNFWANGSLVKDFGPISPHKTVRFAFGEPLKVEGTGKQCHAAIVDFVSSTLHAWGAALPAPQQTGLPPDTLNAEP